MRKLTKIVISFLLIGAVLLVGAFFLMGSRIAALEKEDFSRVDVNSLPDGKYSGCAEALLIRVEVEVQVHDGRIVHIDVLQHRNGQGKPAEIILKRMVEENTVDVDSVSGASASSTVIKAAVLDALESEGRP